MNYTKFLIVLASPFLAFASAETAAPVASAAPAPVLAPDSPSFKINRTVPVQYPLALLRSGITHGEARVVISINSDGALQETLIVAYTHKGFALAALEAINRWTYTPPKMNGVTVGAVVEITLRFEINGILVIERIGVPDYTQRDAFPEEYEFHPRALRELDAIPTPKNVVHPDYPKSWIADGIKGKVVVDFYIDETGKVRMPSVIVAANPLLGVTAVDAVKQWTFSPPLKKRRPVLAHCQQVFEFDVPVAPTP